MLIPDNIKIYLHQEPTDMRKSIDTLCIVVSEQLTINPAEGHLFLFRNRSGNKLKALYYEPNCFTLVYKRLEQGKFIFPKNQIGHIEISHEHFKWLLASDKYAAPSVISATFYENYC
jgi:transposase